MTGIGYKWLEMAGMDGNGWKLQKLLECLEMAGNHWKLLDMVGIAGNCYWFWPLVLNVT